MLQASRWLLTPLPPLLLQQLLFSALQHEG